MDVMAMREPGCNRAGPKVPSTFRTQSKPMLTHTQEKCDCGEQRAADRSPFRSAKPVPRPPNSALLSPLLPFQRFYVFLTLFSKFQSCIFKRPDSSKANCQRPFASQMGLSPCGTCCSKQLRNHRSAWKVLVVAATCRERHQSF